MATTEEGTQARNRVIEALIELVADEGMDAVSVRAVAARAGVTGGMVQHHFATKHAMLLAAARAVTARVAATLTTFRDLPPEQALHRTALLVVPVDDTRTAEARVWLAFMARAAVDPDLAAEHQRTWSELESFLTSLVAAAHDHPTPTRPDRDAAALLLATLDGLATGGLVEPTRLSRSRIRALVKQAVATALK
ncbi:TetR/AcrR family transcriptional regulator [Actinophytocola gossypii]|uniref:TetR family transcriptional regulator n=1 Tax=Actinophytocola gossypii TaxID=2812003 RepID=A0ABT2JDB1_9PSEU|nr:TetR/AcrR family transcriptional regulator [Actinophytocola gossypii]MCT2585868.1 TetR family transcriptional regulator [Actinophytocola gossypii]